MAKKSHEQLLLVRNYYGGLVSTHEGIAELLGQLSLYYPRDVEKIDTLFNASLLKTKLRMTKGMIDSLRRMGFENSVIDFHLVVQLSTYSFVQQLYVHYILLSKDEFDEHLEKFFDYFDGVEDGFTIFLACIYSTVLESIVKTVEPGVIDSLMAKSEKSDFSQFLRWCIQLNQLTELVELLKNENEASRQENFIRLKKFVDDSPQLVIPEQMARAIANDELDNFWLQSWEDKQWQFLYQEYYQRVNYWLENAYSVLYGKDGYSKKNEITDKRLNRYR